MKVLLDRALSSGKLARDSSAIPQLNPLKQYGSGSSRYSQEPPAALSETAAKAARDLAIEPAVKQCIGKFQALDQSLVISELRERLQSIARTQDELAWIKKQLHQPTMTLRSGAHIDIDSLQTTLQDKLEEMRSSVL